MDVYVLCSELVSGYRWASVKVRMRTLNQDLTGDTTLRQCFLTLTGDDTGGAWMNRFISGARRVAQDDQPPL